MTEQGQQAVKNFLILLSYDDTESWGKKVKYATSPEEICEIARSVPTDLVSGYIVDSHYNIVNDKSAFKFTVIDLQIVTKEVENSKQKTDSTRDKLAAPIEENKLREIEGWECFPASIKKQLLNN
ncbi:MAG: hypothetical protein WBG73_13695 [Coleofasciculaceae cyanobacterium]